MLASPSGIGVRKSRWIKRPVAFRVPVTDISCEICRGVCLSHPINSKPSSNTSWMVLNQVGLFTVVGPGLPPATIFLPWNIAAFKARACMLDLGVTGYWIPAGRFKPWRPRAR